MNWFELFAKGHHGYPQPEDDYQAGLYESGCLRCGIHGTQTGAVRLKTPPMAAHSHFIQPNWLFDVFLVHPEVEIALVQEGITGVSFRDVINHKTGNPFSEFKQMAISTIIPSIEVSRLQRVTCMPDNEESERQCPGEKIYRPDAAYCHCIKHYPPTELAFALGCTPTQPDVFQSAEWFGSGGSAYKVTITSERFKSVIENYRFRGIGFTIVRPTGLSKRLQP